MFNKKPKIYKVLRSWIEKGTIHWLMSYDDFNKLYNKQNAIEIDGKVCCSILFGEQSVIVIRQEKI